MSDSSVSRGAGATPPVGEGSSAEQEPFIPGEEGLQKDADLSVWRIEMGDRTLKVRARHYEAAVVWLEVWCREAGVERKGASFVKEADRG